MALVKPVTRALLSVPRFRRAPPHISGVWRSMHSSPVDEKLLGPRALVRQAKEFENDRDAPIVFEDGVFRVGRVEFPNLWLRDNCQCSSCFHGETRQRLLDTFKIPRDVAIVGAATDGEYSNLTWSDGHVSRYPNYTLRVAASNYKTRSTMRLGYEEPSHWGAEIKDKRPVVKSESPEGNISEDTVRDVLRTIRKFGFCLVEGIQYDEPGPTKNVLEKISFIRETHYGGFYDFTSDMASKDTAYTNIALEAHTDTTYFSDPAGLQAFHVLSHTEGEGGASLLVDGFKAAADLKAQDKKAYQILSTVKVHAHASGNQGISIQPYRGFPVLEHEAATECLLRVRWNTSDRAGIELPIPTTPVWYEAARKFDALLKNEEYEYWEKLAPGTLLIFDNWRVLHGRSAFTGLRRVCGGYINRDDWISRYKMLVNEERVLKELPAS